jgi:hypothetical protein
MTPTLLVLIGACLGVACGSAALGVLLWRTACAWFMTALDSAASEMR